MAEISRRRAIEVTQFNRFNSLNKAEALRRDELTRVIDWTRFRVEITSQRGAESLPGVVDLHIS